MGLLEDCKTLFGSDDLFKVLSLSRDADESKIKKAYYKMSLKVHPDKSTEDNLAENTQKFQVLSKVHKILSDKGSREVRLHHTIKRGRLPNGCRLYTAPCGSWVNLPTRIRISLYEFD